jgi:hypothetical protein
MEPHRLKDKLLITKEFLNDLETKSWQEIETLQNQIANIEVNTDNAELLQLLKNLLTSYYIFTGGLENLNNGMSTSIQQKVNDTIPVQNISQDKSITMNIEKPKKTFPASNDLEVVNFEPFEYFVDFDEPSGEPLSDEDLYNL